MRLIVPTLLALTTMACTTAAPPEVEVDLRGAASTSCIDNKEWAYAVNRGAVVYEENCDYCHQDDGSGQPGQVPKLAGNDALLADPGRGIQLILVTKSQREPMHASQYDSTSLAASGFRWAQGCTRRTQRF